MRPTSWGASVFVATANRHSGAVKASTCQTAPLAAPELYSSAAALAGTDVAREHLTHLAKGTVHIGCPKDYCLQLLRPGHHAVAAVVIDQKDLLALDNATSRALQPRTMILSPT